MAVVVIVNWNGARFLARCLSAVHMQTIRPTEILLVDNASSDESLAIARQFSDVRVLALKDNVGFARANNLAVAQTRSEWIALLNPDAFADPRWLESLLTAALNNPDYAAFGCRMVAAENPGVLDGVGDVYHASGLVWRAGHGEPVSRAGGCREIFSPCAAAALYRRDAFVAVGGFDEDFFCYVEDIDLGFRLRLAGYRCLYVSDSVVHHVGSGITGGRRSDFSVYHGHRNLVWAFVKDMPGVLFWLFLPLHVALNLASLVWLSLHGQGAVIFRAKRDALLGLSTVWRKRKEVQQLRTASLADIWVVLDKRLWPRKRK